jgi:hypothetical protein
MRVLHASAALLLLLLTLLLLSACARPNSGGVEEGGRSARAARAEAGPSALAAAVESRSRLARQLLGTVQSAQESMGAPSDELALAEREWRSSLEALHPLPEGVEAFRASEHAYARAGARYRRLLVAHYPTLVRMPLLRQLERDLAQADLSVAQARRAAGERPLGGAAAPAAAAAAVEVRFPEPGAAVEPAQEMAPAPAVPAAPSS